VRGKIYGLSRNGGCHLYVDHPFPDAQIILFLMPNDTKNQGFPD